jgi:hypothetical protein
VALDWDEGDAALSAHVFGTPDRDEVIASIREWLADQGHFGAEVTSLELSVGGAAAIDLPAGSKLFAKFWAPNVDRFALAAQLHTFRMRWRDEVFLLLNCAPR